MNNQKVDMNSSEFQPKNEYLLVKPADKKSEETSAGGIIIPLASQSSLERQTSGTVIETGSDIDDIISSDFVVWPNTDGIDIDFTDGTFVLLRYESVIGSKKR